MQFNIYPTISYNNMSIKDLNVDLTSIYKEVLNKFVVQKYIIISSPRPDQLAQKLYNDPKLEWVLLLLNDVVDPFHGWIRSQEQILDTAELLYDDIDAIHHYVDPVDDMIYYDIKEYPTNSGNWYHIGTPEYDILPPSSTDDILKYRPIVQGDLIPVTNFQYEIDENERLREINILHPQVVRKFVNEVERLINDRINNTRY